MRGLALFGLLALPWPLPAAAAGAALRFERDGAPPRSLDLEALASACGVERVVVERDPYYGGRKSFYACPLSQVLALGFGGALPDAAGSSFFLRARDGYLRPATAERLAEPGAYLAFADADLTEGPPPGAAPRWAPVDRRQVDPGPFYLVWSRPHQADTLRYPWPYQLVAIEFAPFERRFPHVLPRTAPPGAPAWEGFEIFRRDCIACHAINGEGGTVGPDLNVPRSIAEYRPAEQIKAFVRDPRSFRYTSMPAHEHLSAGQLDALVAYFEVMKDLKHDPGAAGGH